MSWPEISVFDNVVVSSLLAGSAKGRMSCMANVPIDHWRMGSRKNAMTVEALEGPRETVKVRVSDPTIYAGPFFLHFGHFISESLHRLWPRLTMTEWHGAKVAYHAFRSAPLPDYALDALALYGIAPDDLIPIRATTQFDRLCIAPQVRQMMGPTLASEYRALLDPVLDERFPVQKTGRRLYVSRLHHHHTGSYFGESYVEAALYDQDFEVIYPERHRLHEMIDLLRASDVAVFAEGSALHILELCGSKAPDAFVIGRRSGSSARFEPLLSAVCERSMTSDHLISSHGVDANPNKHCGLLDIQAVLADMWTFADLPPARHDPGTIRRAVEAEARQLGIQYIPDIPEREP